MRQTTIEQRSIAYFSMEIGVDENIRTYSGGLGILAGDTIRSAADLNVPRVAVTLLYRKGYFRQTLEADGWQREESAAWAVEDFLEETPHRITVPVEGRSVHLRSWKYDVKGVGGATVPIYFLDADLDENSEWDRNLTQTLYEGGKQLIKEIFQAKNVFKNDIRIAYLENYNMALGAMMTVGVDIWLNTPEPPMEASGTRGMKAALNGVPHFSVLDGWWIEGHIKGLTGWSIGEAVVGKGELRDHSLDAPSLYDKLEKAILPFFYRDREGFTNVMIHSIAINGSFFNTQRMMQQYVLNAYYAR